MVSTVTSNPQSASFQQAPVAAQQEVRARNEQTQPRNAPAADNQRAEQRNLQSRDESRKRDETRQQERVEERRAEDTSSSSSRGSVVDISV